MTTEPDRPPPEYGEYASPEEQAKAIARRLPESDRKPAEATPGPTAASARTDSSTGSDSSSGSDPSARTDSSSRSGSSSPSDSSSRSAGSASPIRVAPTRAGDRFVTIFLLAFGLIYLIGGAGGYLDLPTTLNTVFARFGVGDYTPTPATPVFGVAFLVSQSVIWLASAIWSYRRLSQGRQSWWVPVIGAAVTFLVTAILFAVLVSTDPAFVAYLSTV